MPTNRTERWWVEGGRLVHQGKPSKALGEVPTGERFPGDPNTKVTGKTWWGEAHGTNGSVSSHETATNHVLPIRRRYWSTLADLAVPNGSVATAVRADHAAGRLPWVSFKFADWVAAGNGAYDAEMDGIIAELESYAKPTWVIINHEPENDGGDSGAGWEATASAGYRAMQKRFRDRMNLHGNIKRIAFGASLMYYTWNPTSGRDPDAWYPGDGVWDYHGNDHYTEANQEIHRSNPWENFVSYCELKNMPFTLPEWGLRKEDLNAPTKMQNFYNRMLDGTHDCVAFAYFDSNANSTGTGWTLTEENGLLTKYHNLIKDPRSITLAEMGY